jgi:hypothetical protein
MPIRDENFLLGNLLAESDYSFHILRRNRVQSADVMSYCCCCCCNSSDRRQHHWAELADARCDY